MTARAIAKSLPINQIDPKKRKRDAVSLDYDINPDRYRTSVTALEKYGLVGDVHPEVALRLADEELNPILDMGCGEGRFITVAQTYGLSTVAFDQSEVGPIVKTKI